MKKYLSVSAAAIAAVTMFGSAALADPGETLSETLGAPFTDLLGAYDDGSFSNFAVNNANIDGSVDLTAVQSATETDTTSITVNVFGQGGTDTTSNQTIINLNQSAGDVKTTAVGAINDGKIKTTSESAELDVELEVEAQNAASTATTNSATALAQSLDIEVEFDYEYEGVPDIVATNFAFNSSLIDASVTMNGLGADSITTLAAGAVNTGVIEVGIE